MSPNKLDFEKYLNNLKIRLSKAIAGREDSEEGVDPNRRDDRQIAISLRQVPVNTPEGMFDFSFVIHGDCPCSAIQTFLIQVTLQNITFAEGPRGGKVLGIDGRAIKSFYAYKV